MTGSRNVIPIDDWLKTFRAASDELAEDTRCSSTRSPTPRRVRQARRRRRNRASRAPISPSSPRTMPCTSGSRPSRRAAVRSRARCSDCATRAVTEHDVVDGLSEVMNILAGKVKASMAGRDGQLHLGLPMFVANPIRSGGDSESTSADVRLGPVECTLRVYRRQRAA